MAFIYKYEFYNNKLYVGSEGSDDPTVRATAHFAEALLEYNPQLWKSYLKIQYNPKEQKLQAFIETNTQFMSKALARTTRRQKGLSKSKESFKGTKLYSNRRSTVADTSYNNRNNIYNQEDNKKYFIDEYKQLQVKEKITKKDQMSPLYHDMYNLQQNFKWYVISTDTIISNLKQIEYTINIHYTIRCNNGNILSTIRPITLNLYEWMYYFPGYRLSRLDKGYAAQYSIEALSTVAEGLGRGRNQILNREYGDMTAYYKSGNMSKAEIRNKLLFSNTTKRTGSNKAEEVSVFARLLKTADPQNKNIKQDINQEIKNTFNLNRMSKQWEYTVDIDENTLKQDIIKFYNFTIKTLKDILNTNWKDETDKVFTVVFKFLQGTMNYYNKDHILE